MWSLATATMTRLSNDLILVAAIATLSVPFSPFFSEAGVRDTLNIYRPLYDGETLISAGGTFALGFFSPNNSSNSRYVAVWYHDISPQDVVWVANGRSPVLGLTGSLSLSPNGTFLIVDSRNSSAVSWSSPSTVVAVTNPIAQLLDTGNLVVRDAADGDNYLWQSFDYPSNTMLAGMFVGHDLRTGLNHNITSWTSATDPSPGACNVAILLGGVPQLVITVGPGHDVYWRGGPWMGDGFTGAAHNLNYHTFLTITFVMTTERVGYYFEPVGDFVSKLIVYPNGTAVRFVRQNPRGKWNSFWKVPKDQCDVVSICGPFGICNANDPPFCKCPWAFRPKNPALWELTDKTEECVRNTTLDCSREGTSSDGFVTVSGLKMPGTTAAVLDRTIGLDECKARCLRNCSCTGYSLADVRGAGSGCIMWTGELTDMRFADGGQELHVRVAAADVEGEPYLMLWGRPRGV